ncbi:hypothetical protein DL96DRAFT_1615296 [Flagelloscypha sp. PMI_526]|nr:hypothetical protein DL96DRAFT_1615296 [Flagelloscypha sp. PMI_526]
MEESQLRRVPHLWFSDGGIILQAGQSLFRVYQGILSAQSTVFRDMFSLAQPGNDTIPGNTYDGCPLIVLQDAEDETEPFLKAVFDTSYLHHSVDLNECFGVLRLSHKYNCEGLKRPILERLATAFVDSDPSIVTNLSPLETLTQTSRFRAVVICIETQALWLIPHLILSIYTENVNIEECAMDQWRDHPSLLLQFLKGLRLHSTYLQNAFRRVPYRCLDHDPICQNQCNLIQASSIQLGSDESLDERGIPLRLRMQLRRLNAVAEGVKNQMGRMCFDQIVNQIEFALANDWRTFPEHYGFPSWSQLQRMKAEALS